MITPQQAREGTAGKTPLEELLPQSFIDNLDHAIRIAAAAKDPSMIVNLPVPEALAGAAYLDAMGYNVAVAIDHNGAFATMTVKWSVLDIVSPGTSGHKTISV